METPYQDLTSVLPAMLKTVQPVAGSCHLEGRDVVIARIKVVRTRSIYVELGRHNIYSSTESNCANQKMQLSSTPDKPT